MFSPFQFRVVTPLDTNYPSQTFRLSPIDLTKCLPLLKQECIYTVSSYERKIILLRMAVDSRCLFGGGKVIAKLKNADLTHWVNDP